MSGWECAEAGSQQDLRIILCPKPQSPSRSQSTCATGSAPAAQQQLKVAGAEPDAAEPAAESAAAAESEATRCSLGEEPEIAALYGDAPNHLHVLGWTPAAKAGFEVVVLLHGWASPVQWGVQVRGRDGGHLPLALPYMHNAHHACTFAHAHDASMQLCGQLFAMAGFPAHIKPIVYGWPSGKMGALLRPSHKHAPLFHVNSSRTVGRWLNRTCGVRAKPLLAVHLPRVQAWVLPRIWEESTPPTTRLCSATSWSSLKVCSRRAWHGCTSSRTRWATACSSVPSTRSATSLHRSRAAPPTKSPWTATALTVAIRRPPPPPPPPQPCGRFASVASSCFTLRQISTGVPPAPSRRFSCADPHIPTASATATKRSSPRGLIASFARPLRACRFVRSDFAALRRVCSTISLYCDLRDPALFLAEGLVFRSTTLHTALSPKVAHEGWRVRVPRPDMHRALSAHGLPTRRHRT